MIFLYNFARVWSLSFEASQAKSELLGHTVVPDDSGQGRRALLGLSKLYKGALSGESRQA